MNGKNNILNHFGFTLIEMMISIALFGLFITMMFQIFSTNMSIFSKIDKKVEIQQQAQFVLNFIEGKAIEATGVVYLEDIYGNEKHETNDTTSIKKIVFKNNETRKEKGYIFNLVEDWEGNFYNLKYGIGLSGSATVEVGNYIESIEVEPIPSNKKYIEANGISIKINFVFDGERDSVQERFCFRNNPRRYWN